MAPLSRSIGRIRRTLVCLIRTGSRCTKPPSPPSRYSSTSYSAVSPSHWVNRSIVYEPIVTEKRRASAGSRGSTAAMFVIPPVRRSPCVLVSGAPRGRLEGRARRVALDTPVSPQVCEHSEPLPFDEQGVPQLAGDARRPSALPPGGPPAARRRGGGRRRAPRLAGVVGDRRRRTVAGSGSSAGSNRCSWSRAGRSARSRRSGRSSGKAGGCDAARRPAARPGARTTRRSAGPTGARAAPGAGWRRPAARRRRASVAVRRRRGRWSSRSARPAVARGRAAAAVGTSSGQATRRVTGSPVAGSRVGRIRRCSIGSACVGLAGRRRAAGSARLGPERHGRRRPAAAVDVGRRVDGRRRQVDVGRPVGDLVHRRAAGSASATSRGRRRSGHQSGSPGAGSTGPAARRVIASGSTAAAGPSAGGRAPARPGPAGVAGTASGPHGVAAASAARCGRCAGRPSAGPIRRRAAAAAGSPAGRGGARSGALRRRHGPRPGPAAPPAPTRRPVAAARPRPRPPSGPRRAAGAPSTARCDSRHRALATRADRLRPACPRASRSDSGRPASAGIGPAAPASGRGRRRDRGRPRRSSVDSGRPGVGPATGGIVLDDSRSARSTRRRRGSARGSAPRACRGQRRGVRRRRRQRRAGLGDAARWSAVVGDVRRWRRRRRRRRHGCRPAQHAVEQPRPGAVGSVGRSPAPRQRGVNRSSAPAYASTGTAAAASSPVGASRVRWWPSGCSAGGARPARRRAAARKSACGTTPRGRRGSTVVGDRPRPTHRAGAPAPAGGLAA